MPGLADMLMPMLMAGSSAAQQQGGQGGMPQMGQYMDPAAMAQLEVDKNDYQRKAQLAQMLQTQGYVPNSGKFGMLAGLASMLGGTMMANKNEGRLSDIIKRQFEAQSQAAQAQRAQELEDEKRKTDEKIRESLTTEEAKARFGKQYAKGEFTGGGVFDPSTGAFTPNADWMKQQLDLKRAEAGIAASNRAPKEDALANAQASLQRAAAAGLITQEEMQKRLHDLALGDKGGGGNAPAGYRPSADGSSLEAIPGGPADTTKPRQVPADMAGKVALADEFIGNYPAIEQNIKTGDLTGVFDVGVAKAGYGKGGETYRQIQAGRDALQRTLTGAGMPASEADEYTSRYLPKVTDTQDTLLSKQKQLRKELENFTNIARGTTSGAPVESGGNGTGTKQQLSDAELLQKYGGM
jgi:hypothetical protein